MTDGPIYLLMQVRDQHDPMREHEIACFTRALQCRPEQLEIHDLLSGAPSSARLDQVDVVLLGGSGDYSVARGGPWLPAALDAMVALYETSKPTFASCFGFQTMARALGGEVVTDHERAEVGAVPMHLTDEGARDPIFSSLDRRFYGQSGHEDIVLSLPADAVLLASSDRVENEAFRLEGKPIYCTQFHPELSAADLVARISRYPVYLPLCGARTIEELAAITPETPETEALLLRFVRHVLGSEAVPQGAEVG